MYIYISNKWKENLCSFTSPDANCLRIPYGSSSYLIPAKHFVMSELCLNHNELLPLQILPLKREDKDIVYWTNHYSRE